MSKRYGVFCPDCDTFIEIGAVAPPYKNAVTFYAAPTGPIPCKECGSSYLYDKLVTENGEPLP